MLGSKYFAHTFYFENIQYFCNRKNNVVDNFDIVIKIRALLCLDQKFHNFYIVKESTL